MSVHLRRAGRARTGARLRGLLGGLLGVGFVLLGTLGAALPAGAATSPAPSPSGSAAAAPPLEVAVTGVTPQVLRPGGTLDVTATIHNTSGTEMKDARATLRISGFLISTRKAIAQWSDAGPTGAAGTTVLTVPVDAPIAAGGQTQVEFQVTPAQLRLSPAPTAWGPRGIAVEVTDAGQHRVGLDRTFTLWLPAEPVPTVRASVAVPLTGDATDRAGATKPAVPSAATLSRLTDLLEVTKGQPDVAWVVDPALLAALALGDSGSDTPTDAGTASPAFDARVLSSGLASASTGRDVFALPYRDPDLAALAHASAAGPAAAAADLTRKAPLPVLGIPARTDLAWPADPVPDLATVTLAAQTGARAAVVDGSGLATPGSLTYTPTGRATVTTSAGDVAALVADPILTGQLTKPSGLTPATAAQRVLAETAVVARERPKDQRHLLLAPGRGWKPDVATAQAQLAALATAPWIDLVPLPTLMATADPGLERTALPAVSTDGRELSPAAIGELGAARAELATFATIVPDPTGLVAGADAVGLAPLSVAWRSDPHGRDGVVQDVVAGLAARRTGVSIVPGSVLNLISQSGTLPIGLRNTLDQDATVRVTLAPENHSLIVDGIETVTVPAHSDAQARIPFRAVGSGDVRVEVTLQAPDGTAISVPSRLTVRVRADWENVGTAVVAGMLGLAFLVGIVRTIRRGQTRNRGASEAEIAEITAPDTASL